MKWTNSYRSFGLKTKRSTGLKTIEHKHRTRVPRGRARRPRPFAGLAVTDVPPRRTPRTPGSRMMSITQPRSIPAGSRPCADDRARVLRHPYTAMKEPAWASRMPRAGASRPAAMRLPRVRIRARQPHGVTNPQPGGPAGAPPAGPTPKRSLNPSTQATVNAVPGRAWPRKKPTPPSISRSRAPIARPRPANPSTPPSHPRPTAWSPPRPRRPSCRSNGAASPARPPDPRRPDRPPWSPTNTSRATPSTAQRPSP